MNKDTDRCYCFDAAAAYSGIAAHWKEWAKTAGAKKYIVGISGGKDSTVVAWLAVKLFGRDNVIGVQMPNGQIQAASDDAKLAKSICNVLGIKLVDIDINEAFFCIASQTWKACNDPDSDEDEYSPARVNLPPRLRMATLFCVAQQYRNAVVLCTDNLSESTLGYSTFGGDGFGCYAPLKDLTVTEVKKLAEYIGVPEFLYAKTPSDGLQDKTDEQRFGFTYEELDNCIRTFSDIESDYLKQLRRKVKDIYVKNKFKTDIVNVPGPTFTYPNFIKNN